MASVAISAQTVRIEFKVRSLVDNNIYYKEWDTLTTDPLIVDAFEKSIKADSNYEDVKRTVRTTL